MPRNARQLELIEHIPSFCSNCGANFWELEEVNLWKCLECKRTVEILEQTTKETISEKD